MALLHYLSARGGRYGIEVCAVNFDHGMRKETSEKDSLFVAAYCRANNIPLRFFKWEAEGEKTEARAHWWRLQRYAEAVLPATLSDGSKWRGADVVATAHHLNDNAETVLFNLARGSGLAGLSGMTDENYTAVSEKPFKIIRPLISCTRAEIDAYIAENSIPYVDDETNFTDGYTRNKLRLNVLPELEKAVPGAAKAIYRFSRIAAEDERFFTDILKERDMVRRTPLGFEIDFCPEKPLFKRAVLSVLAEFSLKDYTSEWLENLYLLQSAQNGKKFEFAGYSAIKEEGKIAICYSELLEYSLRGCPFKTFYGEGRESFFGQPLYFGNSDEPYKNFYCGAIKKLKFDSEKIPADAVIRFMKEGDKFTKFGGGTKSLGDYFTDKKIPLRVRRNIPVVVSGSRVLIVCGVEISQSVKVDDGAESSCICTAADYSKI